MGRWFERRRSVAPPRIPATVLIVPLLVLVAAPVAGQAAAYGSQVLPGEADLLRVLRDAGAPAICRVDYGVSGSFADDSFYIDWDGDGRLESHDLRLTPALEHPAGSLVTDTDVVEQRDGTDCDPSPSFGYADTNSDGRYGSGDAAYVSGGAAFDIMPPDDATAPDSWTVRLTPYSFYAAGSLVRTSDQDRQFYADANVGLPTAEFAYYDADGSQHADALDLFWMVPSAVATGNVVPSFSVRLNAASSPAPTTAAPSTTAPNPTTTSASPTSSSTPSEATAEVTITLLSLNEARVTIHLPMPADQAAAIRSAADINQDGIVSNAEAALVIEELAGPSGEDEDAPDLELDGRPLRDFHTDQTNLSNLVGPVDATATISYETSGLGRFNGASTGALHRLVFVTDEAGSEDDEGFTVRVALEVPSSYAIQTVLGGTETTLSANRRHATFNSGGSGNVTAEFAALSHGDGMPPWASFAIVAGTLGGLGAASYFGSRSVVRWVRRVWPSGGGAPPSGEGFLRRLLLRPSRMVLAASGVALLLIVATFLYALLPDGGSSGQAVEASLDQPEGLQGGTVPLAYNLWDAEGHDASILSEYSTDGGSTWQAATAREGGEGVTDLATSKEYPGAAHVFRWDSVADGVGFEGPAEVQLRITPRDARPGIPVSTDSFQVDNAGRLLGALYFNGPYPDPAPIRYADRSGASSTIEGFPGQVQVFFVNETSLATAEGLLEGAGASIVGRIPHMGYYLTTVAPGDEDELIARLLDDPLVKDALPNMPLAVGDGVPLDDSWWTSSRPVPLNVPPGGIIIDTSTGGHATTVGQSFLGQGGRLATILDTTAPDGTVSADRVIASIAAAAEGRRLFTPEEPTVINLSISGGGNTCNWGPGCGDTSQAQVDQRHANWRGFASTVLDTVASLPGDVQENILVTIILGNGGSDLTPDIQQLRADPVYDRLLDRRVQFAESDDAIPVSGTRPNGRYSNTANDPSVVRFSGLVYDEEGNLVNFGTSFGAPRVAAIDEQLLRTQPDLTPYEAKLAKALAQARDPAGSLTLEAALEEAARVHEMTEQAQSGGLSPRQAELAVYLAVKTNANGELVLAEVLDKAQTILSASGEDQNAAFQVARIRFGSVGASTTATITPALPGVTVQFTVSGTDGYYDSGSLQTDASGTVAFSIPPGGPGVTDAISVTAVLSGVTARSTWTW